VVIATTFIKIGPTKNLHSTFIKIGPTKNLHSTFGKHLSELGALGMVQQFQLNLGK